ncbi:hypothetical protein [Flavobacterium pectinovorum]|uniref:Uncharacterized protein n=1 Tax=Flavobacterium pectinovorum TaxID=29533 RepID=A0A502EUW4_9FLAO|nr:hypothetical protein [Flavobacterium pectinovorum]TPG40864.1 hypothetical protein EAH81_11015 [Flavobacterium pectinovorum]
MKKLILFTILLISFYSLNAQPLHECYSETGIKIALKGNEELQCSLSPSFNLNDCFFIDPSYIKDSLGIAYFKIKIYKNITDASDDTWKGKKIYLKDSVYIHKIRDVDKMVIYVAKFDKNERISFYLEISEFKKGSFFIDASKIDTVKYERMKSVEYHRGSDTIQGFDITPEKWTEIKKWGD